MSDIPLLDETFTREAGRNLTQEFHEATEIGLRILQIAKERSDGKYTSPFLDPKKFPKEDVQALQPPSGDSPLTPEDIDQARKGSTVLAIEMPMQILEANSRGRGIFEDNENLDTVSNLLKRCHGLVIQVEAKNPQDLIQASREAFARRQNIPPEQVKQTDDELKQWLNDNFQKAGSKLERYTQAVKAVSAMRW